MENETERLSSLIAQIDAFKIKRKVLEEKIEEDLKALKKYGCDSLSDSDELVKKLEADLKSANIKLSRKLKKLERIVDDAGKDLPF